jgi:hypothetical protein
MKYARILSVALMFVLLAAAGCSGKDKHEAKDEKDADKHVHGKGPNKGGVVFDLGKVHAEFAVDHDKKECTLFILGADEKTPKAIAAKDLTVNIKATKTEDGKDVPAMEIKMLPQGEADGKASKFVGTDPGLGMVADFEGTVVGEIDGKPSQGKFKE